MDQRLEVVVIPVADVDRAKNFYAGLGWRLDADFPFDNGFRVVQFTPPGSDCSVQFGTHMTSSPPGSAQGLYLVVSNIVAARGELSAHGAPVSDVFHPGSPGAQFRPDGPAGCQAGPPTTAATARSSPSKTRTATAGSSRRSPSGCPAGSPPMTPPTPASRTWPTPCAAPRPRTASTRSASAHADENWPDWYAAYMVAERAGTELPT